MFKFELLEGELIHIGGIPYCHLGNGIVEGGTDPELARKPLEEQAGENSRESD